MRQASSVLSADIELLRKAEIFSALLDDDLSFVLSRTTGHALPAGARLFSVGDRARRFFIVKEGAVRVFRQRNNGGQDEMALFTPGDALGDFDFAREAVYDANAEAVGDTVIDAFPGEGYSMESLARERPDAMARIKLRSIAMIAARLRSTNKLISENAPWVRELRRRAYEDPGTGLWSRTFMDEELARSLKSPTALVMLKPDRFKSLVDGQGHAAGDEAMVRIASALKDIVRRFSRGWAIRLRSNETALVIPRMEAQEVEGLARLAYREIAALEGFAATENHPAFTFSAAVAYSHWPTDDADWSALVRHTYDALLKLVTEGGDRVGRA